MGRLAALPPPSKPSAVPAQGGGMARARAGEVGAGFILTLLSFCGKRT